MEKMENLKVGDYAKTVYGTLQVLKVNKESYIFGTATGKIKVMKRHVW